MHSPLIEEATALLMLKNELGPLFDLQKQEAIQRFVDEVAANGTPVAVAAATLKQLVQMNFIDSHELSQLISTIMKGSQSQSKPAPQVLILP